MKRKRNEMSFCEREEKEKEKEKGETKEREGKRGKQKKKKKKAYEAASSFICCSEPLLSVIFEFPIKRSQNKKDQ
jgi:hypothetical protein